MGLGIDSVSLSLGRRIFLAGQFEFLHQHLEAMIPANKRAFLSQFYSQVSGLTHLYGTNALKIVLFTRK